MNPFKQAIRSGKPQIGLWQALANPYTAEICAGAGFDWLLLDAEHAPNDLPLILAQLQAIAGYPVEAVVRPPTGDSTLIKQYLDIGVRSLLVPMVESAAQATELVRATRYPPHGIRGIGSAIGRASRWNRTADYLRTASDDICLLLQVESRKGLDNLDQIAAVDGVDGIFIGPSDLAAALGHLGQPGHADVQAAIENGISRTLLAGRSSGILIADETLAHRYLEIGAAFVAVGTDVTILARGAEALARRFKPQPKPNDPGGGGVY